MLSNYLKAAFRNLLKNKFFTGINIFGLAIGLTCCLLIWQYNTYHFSYDKFHEQRENLYRVRNDHYAKGNLETESAVTYAPVAPAMKAEMPEVVDYVRFRQEDGGTFTYTPPDGAPVIFNEEKAFYADPSVFKVFSFPLAEGDPATALTQPNTAAVSEKMARKLFGNDRAIGKTIRWYYRKGEHSFVVNGVFKDVPSNSHLKFEVLLSFQTLINLESKSKITLENNWGWPAFYTYVLLNPGTNPGLVEAKFPAMIEKYNGEQLRMINHKEVFTLQPLTDIHLYSHLMEEAEVNGNAKTVDFLILVALFILLLAWANYINLSTARAMHRAKEVGVRKAIGASHQQLMVQFLFETLILNLAAGFVALVAYAALLPLFRQFADTDFGTVLLRMPLFWLLFLGGLVVGSVLAGAYPAFVLSGFKPVEVLKGKINFTRSRVPLRKILVVFQFVISIALITGTYTVFDQISYMRSQRLGLDIDQVVAIKGPRVLNASEDFALKSTSFKKELLQDPFVKGVTSSNSIPGKIVKKGAMFKRKADDWQNGKVIHILEVDHHFFSTYDIPLAAGRSFTEASGEDNNNGSLMVNETAARLLGFGKHEEAINTEIDCSFDPTRKIVGVVRDFHQKSLQNDYEPLVFLLKPAVRDFYEVKIAGSDVNNAIASIQKRWNQFFPGNPFDYFFLDEFFDKQYKADQQFGQIFAAFAVMGIFIACLGLFGLTTFTIAQRSKEIGVRKVMGASIVSVVLLLTKELLRVILAAFVVATLLAYYLSSQWLQQYVFRISLTPWHFILPGLLVLLIALLAISYQTIKIAQVDPTRSLKQS